MSPHEELNILWLAPEKLSLHISSSVPRRREQVQDTPQGSEVCRGLTSFLKHFRSQDAPEVLWIFYPNSKNLQYEEEDWGKIFKDDLTSLITQANLHGVNPPEKPHRLQPFKHQHTAETRVQSPGQGTDRNISQEVCTPEEKNTVTLSSL